MTGSAHCALGPYWAARLGKPSVVGWQASKRGGAVAVEVPQGSGRVAISGEATVAMEGVVRL